MARLDYWFRRSLKKNDEPLGGINKRINQHLNSVFTFLETQPDVPELTAIRLSLMMARAFLAAAIKGIEKSRVIQEVDAEAFSPAQIIPSESFEDAAAEVGKIHERVSAACDLRFADVQGPHVVPSHESQLGSYEKTLSVQQNAPSMRTAHVPWSLTATGRESRDHPYSDIALITTFAVIRSAATRPKYMHEWLFSICPLLLTVFENVASKHVISSIAIVMLAYRTVMTRMYLDVVRVYGFCYPNFDMYIF